MKDIDFINEAYKQINEMAVPGQNPDLAAGFSPVQEDGLDDNNTSLEPGERISGIKKSAILDVIMKGLDELVAGNTGPDSPCSERDALDLIVSSCNRKLQEMSNPGSGGY